MATQTEACRLASEDVASYVSTDSSNLCALASAPKLNPTSQNTRRMFLPANELAEVSCYRKTVATVQESMVGSPFK